KSPGKIGHVIMNWVVAQANLPTRARWYAKADEVLPATARTTKRESDDPPIGGFYVSEAPIFPAQPNHGSTACQGQQSRASHRHFFIRPVSGPGYSRPAPGSATPCASGHPSHSLNLRNV